MSQLIALTPHQQNAAQWAPVVTALKAFRSKKLEQEAVARKADAAAFAADTRVISAIIDGLEEDLIAAGFQPSDDCYTIFSA